MPRFEWSAIFGDSEAKQRRGSFNNVDLTAQQQAILAHYLQSRPPEYLVPRRMRKRRLRSASILQRLQSLQPLQLPETQQPLQISQVISPRSPHIPGTPRTPRSPRTPRTVRSPPRSPPRSPRSPGTPPPIEDVTKPRRRKSLFDAAAEKKTLLRSNSLYMNADGRVVKPLQEIRRRSLVAKLQLSDVLVEEEEIPDEASKATQLLLRGNYMRLMTQKEMFKRELRRGMLTGSQYRQKVQLASQEFQFAYAQAYEAIEGSITDTKRLVMKRASSDTMMVRRRSQFIEQEEAKRAQNLAALPWQRLVQEDVLTTRDTI